MSTCKGFHSTAEMQMIEDDGRVGGEETTVSIMLTYAHLVKRVSMLTFAS